MSLSQFIFGITIIIIGEVIKNRFDYLVKYIGDNTRVSNYLVQSQEALLRSNLTENAIIRRYLISNTQIAQDLLEAQESVRRSYRTEVTTLRELLDTQGDQLRVYRTQLNSLEFDVLTTQRHLARLRRQRGTRRRNWGVED